MKMRLQVLLQTERRYRAITTGENPKGDAPVHPETSPYFTPYAKKEKNCLLYFNLSLIHI